MIIDGKKIANELINDLKIKFNSLEKKKFFGAMLIGNDVSGFGFLKIKEKIAKDLNVDFRIYQIPENITTDKLRDEIQKIACRKTCGGFTVQLPLPSHINTYYVLNAIPSQKDVDVLSERSLGGFYTGRLKIFPPAVAVLEEIIKRQNIDLKKLKTAVIGYGFLVGKPISFYLSSKVSSLSIFREEDINFREKLKEFDFIVSGVGKAGLFSSKDLKENTIVIDFGYDFDSNGKICGDFLYEDDKEIIYTPTPGGTGPILVAKLFQNFYTLVSLNK
jgi:methylenetetrahydrofolate dehydrogenase (NADP+)/methenyltetrahydrofolate cyclohydrolase